MKKLMMVAVLLLAGAAQAADDNPVMRADKATQVCKLTGFMAQVADPAHEPECSEVPQGAKALLMGVIQAGRTFYLLADTEYEWWIADPYDWRKFKERSQ